jgi:hypothetical protein
VETRAPGRPKQQQWSPKDCASFYLTRGSMQPRVETADAVHPYAAIKDEGQGEQYLSVFKVEQV